MSDLERYLHSGRQDLPALLVAGLAHTQFETIHPFLDGNGRIGRLLITLLLCDAGILGQPMLYLSLYLKQNRAEYYERLTESVAMGGGRRARVLPMASSRRAAGRGGGPANRRAP
jgi:Fic family protein